MEKLWFAFKLYLWRIEKQQPLRTAPLPNSCDLLSNCIFDVLKNNAYESVFFDEIVVICFQIVSLTYWKTTKNVELMLEDELWFAFKLYLWRIEKQLASEYKFCRACCDLLSNCIFDVLKNNFSVLLSIRLGVVICFQIVSLTYWKTTDSMMRVITNMLWFAFKLYLWRIEKQQFILLAYVSVRCDLLSNCIFDVLKNNTYVGVACHMSVVICFQIVSLTYWKTTTEQERVAYYLLWFAFKLYLWRIEKQLCINKKK